ncbi:MAG: elongation factor P [Candidatus Omnitrophota bacterium]
MTYTDLKPGVAFMYQGNPYIVVSGQFHRMQMRKAVMRTMIRNLLTGQLVQKTFTASEQFDPAAVNEVTAEYLYRDNETYHFMDKETYEQYHSSQETLGDKVKFLIENETVTLILYNHNPVQLVLPKHVFLKVIESPQAIKGDSVTNSFKTVTCENGVKVSCPLFIREGDRIKINTETGEYLERAN